MRKNKGFTLIELLVVIAIIGLLSALAVVSLNSARQKSRDARRVSDIKQIQTALELFYDDTGAYIDADEAITLGDATHGCLDEDGLATPPCDGDNIYMVSVPADPGTSTTYSYLAADPVDYAITFTLESGVAGLDGTACTATSGGLSCS